MTQEIESVTPAISVVIDDGDFIINSTGPLGKQMAQAVLPLAAGAKKVTIITDGEMKVMKRNAAAENGAQPPQTAAEVMKSRRPSTPIPPAAPAGPDIQEEFVADLEAGVTGEQATGEVPATAPTTTSSTKASAKRAVPRIYQDAAAPPAPELAEAEMDRLLQEAAQAEQDQAKIAEDRRFQRQQAVQAGVEAGDVPMVDPAEGATPRRRKERTLATTGKTCGRCGGGGQIQGEAGFVGACPVCGGEGQVKTWDRSLKVR
jgi:hypothetical protein